MKKKVNPYLKSKIKSENFVIVYFVAFLFILVIAVIFRNKTNLRVPFFPNTGTVINTPFVSTNGTKLYANGELYQFTGVNVFNLASYTGNAGCGGQVNDLDAFFYKLRPNSTVRMWAFQGSMATNTTTKLTDWTGLDRVVAAAQKDGIKLILVLSDQSGTCDDGHWKDSSWYAGGYNQAFNDNGSGLTPLTYLDYVKLVVNRYKDSTAVAMWEPVNEPQSSDCAGAQGSACYSKITCNETVAASALRSFFDTVGGAIKAIDKNHLVSSGVIGGGQCGAQFEDYKYLHSSPGIDVASYHDYDNDDSPMPGDQWNGLQKRLDQMALINKPLIIGEVGMKAMDNYQTAKDARLPVPTTYREVVHPEEGFKGFIITDLTAVGANITLTTKNMDPYAIIDLYHDEKRSGQMKRFEKSQPIDSDEVQAKLRNYTERATKAKLALSPGVWTFIIEPDGQYKFLITNFVLLTKYRDDPEKLSISNNCEMDAVGSLFGFAQQCWKKPVESLKKGSYARKWFYAHTSDLYQEATIHNIHELCAYMQQNPDRA